MEAKNSSSERLYLLEGQVSELSTKFKQFQHDQVSPSWCERNGGFVCWIICILIWFSFFITFSIYMAHQMQEEDHDCNKQYDKHICNFFNQTLNYNAKSIDITYQVALLDSNVTFIYHTRCTPNKKCNGLFLNGTRHCFVKNNDHIVLKFNPMVCENGPWYTGGIFWFIFGCIITFLCIALTIIRHFDKCC